MDAKLNSQKEYLKRYLSSGICEEKKKRKKKKLKVGQKTVKIIDDDIDLEKLRPIEDGEFDIFLNGEDAPQIAGVVDERGPVDFSDKRKWKIIADDEDGELRFKSSEKDSHESVILDKKEINKKNGFNMGKESRAYDSDISPPRRNMKDEDSDISLPRRSKKSKDLKKSKHNYNSDSSPHKKGRKDEDSDISPPRKSRKDEDSDFSPPRKSRKKEESDLSPPRKSKKIRKHSKKNKQDYDSDLSPSRKIKKSNYSDLKRSKKSKRDYDSDLTPPRKNKKDSDSDLSPPRRNKKGDRSDVKQYDLDLSPPRRSRKDEDSDLSPPRRSKKNDSKKQKHNNDSDFNPVRKNRKDEKDIDLSRQRSDIKDSKRSKDSCKSYKNYKDVSSGSSYKRKNYDSGDQSPPRQSKHKRRSPERYKTDRRKDDDRHCKHRLKDNGSRPKDRSSRWDDQNDRSGSANEESTTYHDVVKMRKTLSGRTAGLQDAKALREESEAFKKREAEMFSKLSKEITGVGQTAVLRDSKTGRKRDLEAEAAVEREKQKRQEELNEKYEKWGTGLKQVENREEKLKDDLYEMSKPLARYADDADLDKQLREQEREGDPMLAYIRQKQIKEGKIKPERPQYQGSYMPNRFGIKPGHRWDGVDRSNGYEKKWYDAQNAKLARQEEAYKWSTADM